MASLEHQRHTGQSCLKWKHLSSILFVFWTYKMLSYCILKSSSTCFKLLHFEEEYGTNSKKSLYDKVLYNANFHAIIIVSRHIKIKTSRHLVLSSVFLLCRVLQKPVDVTGENVLQSVIITRWYLGNFRINSNFSPQQRCIHYTAMFSTGCPCFQPRHFI